MGWERAVSTEQLDTAGKATYQTSKGTVAIFKTDAGIFAIENACGHRGVPLIEGSVEADCVLTCGAHFWKYDMKTGKCLEDQPEEFHRKVYKTKIEDEAIWIYLSEFDIS